MITLLKEKRFDIISKDDKAFIIAFDNEMKQLGYHFGEEIGSGYCWGKYMIIYRKIGVKSKKVYARIYIRDDSIVLRLFFSKVESHKEYIENACNHIKETFIGDYGRCNHCNNEKDGKCKFRKTYRMDGRVVEKCNGETFMFHNPIKKKLQDYIELFLEFYPDRKRKANIEMIIGESRKEYES